MKVWIPKRILQHNPQPWSFTAHAEDDSLPTQAFAIARRTGRIINRLEMREGNILFFEVASCGSEDGFSQLYQLLHVSGPTESPRLFETSGGHAATLF